MTGQLNKNYCDFSEIKYFNTSRFSGLNICDYFLVNDLWISSTMFFFIIPCILSVPIILENEDKWRQVQNMSHVKDWCCFLKFWIKYSVTVIFDTQTGYKRSPGNDCLILPVLTPACLSLCLSLITMVTCLCVPECFARFEWYPPWCFACDHIHHSP